MSGEDHLLPVKLERLEIESGRVSATNAASDENPFQRRSTCAVSRTNTNLWGGKCNCSLTKKSTRNKVAFKRSNGKLLKEPIMKYVNYCCQGGSRDDLTATLSTVSLSPVNRSNLHRGQADPVHLGVSDFRSLVSSCSQLRISNDGGCDSEGYESAQNRDCDRLACPSVSGERQPGLVLCSQQALNPSCDVTIDELASYFETLVHIPKKMSTMAEMMYI